MPNPPIELLKQYPEYLTLKHPLDAMASGKAWDCGISLVMAANCSDKMVNKTLPGFPQSACLRKNAGISKSSMPPDDSASTLAAAWVRFVRHTLGTDMLP